LMGALMMYNIQPGPLLFDEHPQLVWGLIASMFIGNVMLLILNLPFIKFFAKIIETPIHYLLPMILAISIFGVYAVQLTTFDLWVLLICGVAGYIFVRHDYPIAPLVLGLVLGPMIENNLRRALTASNGDFLVFVERPLSITFLLAALLWLVLPFVLRVIRKKSSGLS